MLLRSAAVPLLLVATAVALALAHSGEIRERGEEALGRGMPAREAALARGFVLGRDEQVDAATTEDFRRSGLAHLLAVSGQNVALLALLAMPLLAALAMPLRTRLLWVVGLIAVYVPLAGSGPSIQRAAIMGGLSVLATLAGRRASRFYALLLAAAVLLAVDPGIGADVGWQLSFAAVLGILLLATPLREALLGRAGGHGMSRLAADGAALTVAATLTTAPLIAFHFEAISTTTLVANLLALPAIAPAMWLGMLVAAAGQIPGFPVEPLNGVNAALLAYIAEVAAWCARPEWAYPRVELGAGGLIASYAGIAAACLLDRRRALAPLLVTALALALPALALAAEGLAPGGDSRLGPPAGLRVTVLDVGQGDAILLEPAGRDPVLVDTGPAGAEVAERLEQRGIDRLAALVITHPEDDHDGGAGDVLARIPTGRLVFARASPVTVAAARGAGTRPVRVAAGARLRYGALRLNVLWPPPQRLAARRGSQLDDPNSLSLVMLARWRGFEALLAGDAEAEAAPLAPGPVDVLKVAHHGSEDAGLERLLADARPRLALISVGENPYGHPSPATLAALDALAVPVLRTDQEGEIAIDVADSGWSVR
jgi:competence protein ComEC